MLPSQQRRPNVLCKCVYLAIFEVVNNADNHFFRYFFDAETKLLIQFEKYQLVGENYELADKFEFFKYNQSIDDSLFELDDIPDGALIFAKNEGVFLLHFLQFEGCFWSFYCIFQRFFAFLWSFFQNCRKSSKSALKS